MTTGTEEAQALDTGTRTGAAEDAPRARMRPREALLALAVLLCGLGVWATYEAVHTRLLDGLAERYRGALTLYVAGLRGTLEKYRALPTLVADHPATGALLAGAAGPEGAGEATRMRANRLYQRIATVAGASDIYLMGADGTTLAASNWNGPHSFVGRNFSFRPYFQQALAGKVGRFYAVGTTSDQRGYYFAAPVRRAGAVAGAAVVKVAVEGLEADWGDPAHDVIVTDPASIVFMASRPAWRFKQTAAVSAAAQAELARTRRYAGRGIAPLPIRRTGPALSGEAYPVRVAAADGRAGEGSYLRLDERMADAGWTVSILADTGPATREAALITAALWLAAAGAGAIVWMLTVRRRVLREKLAAEETARRVLQQNAAELERRVDERTAALRKAQDELVQAAKLAALGRLLAGLGHEINQPLTAIRGYARNALTFLDRGEEATARDNLRAVGELTERAGRIIAHLKGFARKSEAERRPVRLAEPIGGARQIVESEANRAGVSLAIATPAETLTVMADPVRLEQVLVNLLSNAIDAVRDAPRREVTLSVEADPSPGPGSDPDTDPGRVAVVVADTGPGVPDSVRERIFEPFYTTKRVGEGLGLGLSISQDIVVDMGGHLALDEAAGGGARFTVTLHRPGRGDGAPAGAPASTSEATHG